MSDTLENNEVITETEDNQTLENIPSMDDFKDELNSSFRSIKEGDLITGTIIDVTDTEAVIDIGYFTQGVIVASEISNDPSLAVKDALKIGESVTAVILEEDDGDGNVSLSLKQANDMLSWEKLTEAMNERHVYSCKVKEIVNGGVITYIEGIRGFIPASQLSTAYVEDLEEYRGKTVEAIVITVDQNKNKLVLSAREVEHEKQVKEHDVKVSSLQIGLVTTGTVDKIMPYGAFINIGDNLSGLVHISQICGRHIKSPKEVISEGQEVKVKIIDVKDGKISLSMKAVEEKEEIVDNVESAPIEYSENESASTSLGSLLAKFKLNN